MSDDEQGQIPDAGDQPVREYVPGHRPPPAAGCFGGACPTDPPRRRRPLPLSIEEFERRFAGSCPAAPDADRGKAA